MGKAARVTVLTACVVASLLLMGAESPTCGSTVSSEANPWDEIPYIHQFSLDTPFTCDVGGPIDCSLAKHTGRPGWRAKGVKIRFEESQFTIRLEIFDDGFSDYYYTIGFSMGEGAIYVELRPNNRRAEVIVGEPQGDTHVGFTSSDSTVMGSGYCEVSVPYTMVAAWASPDDLRSWRVSFEMGYPGPDEFEIYWYAQTWTSYDDAAAATQASVTDVVGLEYLGNPFAARLPDGSGWEASRRVWDMQVFGDRIYMAHGSVAANSGPTPVWYWDCTSETFVHDFTVDDEEIHSLKVIGDEMLVAGFDATESWDFGNLYIFDGSRWSKLRTLPDAVHCLSVWRFAGSLFASITRAEQPSQVLKSDDDGLTWAAVPVTCERHPGGGQFFEFRGQLCLSRGLGSGVLAWDGNSFAEVPGLSLFPEEPLTLYKGREYGYGMRMFDTMGDDLVYVGEDPPWGLHSQLYSLRAMSAEGVVRLPVGAASTAERGSDVGTAAVLGEEVWDVVVEDGVCWVLVNQMHVDDVAATARVYRSTDLASWEKVLEFASPTAATSFEVHGGYIYVGLGPGHPHTYYESGSGIGESHPATGCVYRFRLALD